MKHGTFAAAPDSLIPADSVVGYVFAQLPGSPIRHAKLTIASDSTRTFFTDSTGRFAAPRPVSQAWTVRAQMIGYLQRADTVRVATSSPKGGVRLRIGLEAQGFDGDCSSYLICTKRRGRSPS